MYEMFKNEDCELLVCNPVENRSYKRAKTDKLDARQLADLLRGNFLTPVYHDGSDREKFRDLKSSGDTILNSYRIKYCVPGMENPGGCVTPFREG